MDAAVEKFIMRGRRQGIQEGIQQGMKQGIQQGMDLIRILLDSGRSEDVKRSVEDKEYREKLLREFNL